MTTAENARNASPASKALDTALSWAGGAPLALFFLVTPALAVGGAMGLPAMQSAAAILAAPGAAIGRGIKANWPFLACLAAFIGWAAVSATWSPYAQPMTLETNQVVKLIGGVTLGLVFVAAAGRDLRTRAVTAGLGAAAVLVLCVLLLVEAFLDMPLNRMGQPDIATGFLMRNPGRGGAVLSVLVWGALGVLIGRQALHRLAWRFILVTTAVIALQFATAANAAAFLAGGLGFMAAYAAPRMTLTASGLILATGVLAAPALAPLLHEVTGGGEGLPLSWAVRLQIWPFTVTQIAEAPLLGHGLDASRTFGDHAEMAQLRFALMPLHPHNAPLHVWLETGLVGAVLAAACLACGGWLAGRALAGAPRAAAAAAGGLWAAATQWTVSFGAWQEWLIATAFAAAALAVAAGAFPGRSDEDA